MASQYFAILTDYGTRAIAHALSQGQPLQLSQFAVGDGNGQAVTPTASATALVHQTHIAPVSAVSLDPRNNKQVIVELTIPENVGGFYIREMGVFDAQNKLIAYANCPESFKPTESSGSGKVQVLRMILKVESSSAVTLSIDNSVIFVTRQQMTPKTITATTQNGFDESGHSHEINKASTSQQGIVQLTNDTGLESESLALTAKAGKKLAQLIATVQLALNNYIPLNKRSSAVNSNDENNVATSKAVKTAYDKGMEAKTAADNAQRTANDGVSKANAAQTSANQAKSAADTAQRTANDGVSKANEANNNANGRVPKTGDTTIIGTVRVQHQQLNAGSWSELQLAAKEGYWRLEVNPNSHDANERRFNMVYANGNAQHYLQFPTICDSGQTVAYQEWVNAQLGDYAQQKGLGSADLDTITKSGIYGQDANSNATTARHYPEQKAGMLIVTAQSGYGAQQVYIPYDTYRLYVRGRNANQWQNWQRVDGIDSIALSSISHATNGNNKTKVASEFALGELNKRMDKLINESIYHKHYDGAKVLRLRVDNNGGWKIIKMKASRINVPSNGEVILNLPEAITMDSVITATDDGNAKFSYGAVMMSATTIKIFAIAGRTIGINITIMGGGAF